MNTLDRKAFARWLGLQALAALLVLGAASAAVLRIVARYDATGAHGLTGIRREEILAGVDAALFGNSLLFRGVNEHELNRRLAAEGRKGVIFWDGGSSLAFWYLANKNIACRAEKPPRVAAVFFLCDDVRNPATRAVSHKRIGLRLVSDGREPELTRRLMRAHMREGRGTDAALTWLNDAWPAYSAKHSLRNYAFEILTKAPGDFLRWLEPGTKWPSFARAKDRQSPRLRLAPPRAVAPEQPPEQPPEVLDPRPGRYDFAAMLDESLLPPMLEDCRRHGIRLALVRMKPNPRRNAAAIARNPVVSRYLQDLAAWCATNGVGWLDLEADPDLTQECFHIDDHMNKVGREVVTPKIADWLLGEIRIAEAAGATNAPASAP
jgi:hypothetical protein